MRVKQQFINYVANDTVSIILGDVLTANHWTGTKKNKWNWGKHNSINQEQQNTATKLATVIQSPVTARGGGTVQKVVRLKIKSPT